MKRRGAFILAVLLILTLADNATVLAGGINEHEASVIAVAGGIFQYQGKSYVAKAEYQAQLQAKLSEDGIDLTADQASEAISMIYANVETGVTEGYLEEVARSDDEPDEEDDQKKKGEASGNRQKETNSPKEESAGHSTEENNPEAGADASEIAVTMEEIIASDQDAVDYHGYNIKEIYRKTPEERTEEEQQVYEDYVAEKAIEQLHLGESKGKDASSAAAMEEGTKKTLPDLEFVLPAMILLAGAAVIGGGIRWILRRRKIAKNWKKLPEIFIDIHSHVLPGLDDGSPDMETTLRMIEMAYQQGIRCMIATPHYRSDGRHHRTETLLDAYERVCSEIKKHHPDFRLLLGNEIFFTESALDKLEKGRALTLAESRYVLVEFSPDDSCQWIQAAVIKLLRELYVPVIAHAERYRNLVRDLEQVEELRHMGAWIQVNANGGKLAQKLWKAGCVDLLASDCHDFNQRKPDLQKGLVQLCAYGDDELIKRVLVKNPGNIIYTEKN